VEKLGEDLIHERDDYGNYPISSLLCNIQLETMVSIERLINLLSTNDMAPLIHIKDTIINMLANGHSPSKRMPYKRRMICDALDLFALHDIFTDEDRKKIFVAIQPTPKTPPKICALIIHAITVMKMTS
jgi:hypothetical protein